LLAAAQPLLGGVLLRGDKGSAKTTLARGLAALLPGQAPFVELPLGAGEERVIGSIELAALLAAASPSSSPGCSRPRTGACSTSTRSTCCPINGALAWLSDHVNQLACLFGTGNSQSVIAAACALPNVDCNLGIATWGHSQGGYVAAMAHNVEPRVRGAWATGYGGDGAATLSKNRLRVVNGEADIGNGMATTLNTITGLTPAQCPDPDQCLRDDGSGWILVRLAELASPSTSSADHCWFDRPSCGASMIALEPNWVSPTSSKPFAIGPNADWLAITAQRP
jgi:hypothetical protein